MVNLLDYNVILKSTFDFYINLKILIRIDISTCLVGTIMVSTDTI